MITDISKYTDCYFTKTKVACKGHNPLVEYQVFQKHTAVLAGMGLVTPMFEGVNVTLKTRTDGDTILPWEAVMVLRGYLQDIVEMETVYLGILDECTRVASAVRQAAVAAMGKPVLFFPARFAAPEVQFYHGYAARIGGAVGCSTQEQTRGYVAAHAVMTGYKGGMENAKPIGTMPHAMIAVFGGNTVAASLAFAETHTEPVWALVDFHNDCAFTAVQVLKAFQAKGIAHRLAGVRLDTSERLVDYGLVGTIDRRTNPGGVPQQPGTASYIESVDGKFKGVCPELVHHVRKALNEAGGQHVKIGVSGGFTPEKIDRFETAGVPADVYAVGEGFLKTNNAFTSDICRVWGEDGWEPMAKVGRSKLSEDGLVTRKTMAGMIAAIAG